MVYPVASRANVQMSDLCLGQGAQELGPKGGEESTGSVLASKPDCQVPYM